MDGWLDGWIDGWMDVSKEDVRKQHVCSLRP